MGVQFPGKKRYVTLNLSCTVKQHRRLLYLIVVHTPVICTAWNMNWLQVCEAAEGAGRRDETARDARCCSLVYPR